MSVRHPPALPAHRSGNAIRVLIVLLALAPFLFAQPTTRPSTRPATSYKYEMIASDDPALRAFVVRIDLTDPNIALDLASGGPDPDGEGPWETVLQPTSVIAKANDFDIAINTVFFMHKSDPPDQRLYQAGDWASSVHLLMEDGKVLTGRREGVSLVIDAQGSAYIGTIKKLPTGAKLVVSGNQQIVFRGKNAIEKPDKTRHPRTAIGLADDDKTLVILVADGRRKGWSDGLTTHELAERMLALGCRDAINLDGGGSSTLVMKTPDGEHAVINIPSDGSTAPFPLSIERSVPYVLGVKIKKPTTQPAGK